MIPSNRMQSHQTMKLIMTTYPGFQTLPKGVKQMLLVSESFFFDEMRQPAKSTVATSNANGSPPFSLDLACEPGIVEAMDSRNVASVQRSTL